jgi:hypothetical protein
LDLQRPHRLGRSTAWHEIYQLHDAIQRRDVRHGSMLSKKAFVGEHEDGSLPFI